MTRMSKCTFSDEQIIIIGIIRIIRILKMMIIIN